MTGGGQRLIEDDRSAGRVEMSGMTAGRLLCAWSIGVMRVAPSAGEREESICYVNARHLSKEGRGSIIKVPIILMSSV